MLKRYSIITFLMMCFLVKAHAMDLTESQEGVTLSLREDSLKWKIKNNKDHPLVNNEFCFDNVKLVQWGIKSQVTIDHCFLLKALGDYALSYNKPQDSAYDLFVGGGYELYNCDCDLKVTPIIGFVINQQRFKNCKAGYSAVRYIPETFSEPHYFADLKTRYRSYWYGPSLGLDINYMLGCGWKAYGSIACQYAFLRSKGHASVGDLTYDGYHSRDSIHQHGQGYGLEIGMGMQYQLTENWLIDFSGVFEKRKALWGRQHVRHDFDTGSVVSQESHSSSSSNEDDIESLHDHLKNVEWRSFRVELALSYYY